MVTTDIISTKKVVNTDMISFDKMDRLYVDRHYSRVNLIRWLTCTSLIGQFVHQVEGVGDVVKRGGGKIVIL